MRKRSEVQRTRTGKPKKAISVKAAKPKALQGGIPKPEPPPQILGTPGLWMDGPGSVFNNSRMLYTTDPTEHEQDLTKTERVFKPLRHKNKGRVEL